MCRHLVEGPLQTFQEEAHLLHLPHHVYTGYQALLEETRRV